MLRKFASIAHPTKYGYAWDSEAFDVNAPIRSAFRMYETYGDGLCQHSGDWGVTAEYLADFLASLAQTMFTDDELTQNLVFCFIQKPNDKAIAFAASVIFKETDREFTKRRYYSVAESKISKAPAKEHDKRYQQIESWCDGSAGSIYRILTPEYADGLNRLCYASAIRDWLLAHDGYMAMPAEFLKWEEDRDKSRLLRDAFEACTGLAEAYQLKSNAQAALNNYTRTIERKKETAETVETA